MDFLYPVALTFIKGIGPIHSTRLINEFGDCEAIFKEKSSCFASFSQYKSLTSDKIKSEALRRAEQELKFAQKHNITIHYCLDKSYPFRLKECEDRPIILYSCGNSDLNSGKWLAMVGTRKITQYGRDLCSSTVGDLATLNSNINIVSGLAYGIDAASHRAALESGLKTFAVVAHGLDIIYPTQNQPLAKKIIENNGAIVTEYPSGSFPDPYNFVQRNRIIAGLSEAVVVVESAKKGGALLTALAATSYDRDVFAFPARIDDIYSQGCNNLIKTNQAQMITSASDILQTMGWAANSVNSQKIFIELTPEEKTIVEQLHKTPSGASELSRLLKMPVQKVVAALVQLEFNGVVKFQQGSTYRVV